MKIRLEFPGCGVGGIAAASIQCQGAREYQEDSCGFSEVVPGELSDSFCAVVADGMGGLNAGAFVSDYAVKSLLGQEFGGEIPLPEQLVAAMRRISG